MKRLFTPFLCLVIALTATAGNRSLSQMRKIASQKLSSLSVQATKTRTVSNAKQVIGTKTLTVFSDGQGFAVISRDDRFPALLAYGQGNFNPDDMPNNVKWWFDAVQNFMESGIRNGITVTRAGSYKEIKPLLTTKWGQGTPFNNYAPSLKLYDGRKAPAGCVAIAMAQCMNFQKFPASAKFEGHYYQEGVSDEVYQGNVDSKYSWPYNNYYRYYYPEGSSNYVEVSYTPRQGNLVATLCRDCAYAIDMQYTVSGSGAHTFDVPDALINRFSYPAKAVRFYDRRFYSLDEWRDLVYGELAMGTPFIYSGCDKDGKNGHAFVADGNDAEGLIHFNWGWSGALDGYFAMDVLTPDESSDFSYSQNIVTGIRPNTIEGDKYGSLVCTSSPFTFTYDKESLKLTIKCSGLYNYGKTIVGRVGFVLENLTNPDDSGCLYLMSETNEKGEKLEEEDYTLPPYYGYREFEWPVELTEPLAAGEYKVYLGSMDIRYEDEYQMGRTFGGTFYYEMSVDKDGNATIGEKPVMTAIESVFADTQNDIKKNDVQGVFDLNGRNFGNNETMLRKGIFIKNGKKFISK